MDIISDPDSEEEVAPVLRNSSSETSCDEEEEVKPPVAEERKDETMVQSVTVEETKMSTITIPTQKPRRKRFIPKYDVEGVNKVVVGEDTQIQVEIVIGTDVSAQYPWKEVDKEKIIENIQVGGELSEFFPLKELIEAYPGEHILIGYIADESRDTDEFYICCTQEARDHCKEQSDRFIRRQEKKLEKAVLKKPRPWTNLGSDKEIMDLVPVNTRNLMEIEIKAKFPTEYEPDKFRVRDANDVRDGYVELTPYRQKFNNVFRRRVDCAIQASPPLTDRPVQTVLKYPQNMWTQSIADALGKMETVKEEGGGGDGQELVEEQKKDEQESSDEEDEKAAEPVDEVGLAAYKAAFSRMRRPSYVKKINNFMTTRHEEMQSIIELNTVMDIYCNDYPNLVVQKSTDTYSSMTFEEYVCFTDVRAKDKYVSSAAFHPMWSGIVAVCYSDGSPKVMKKLSTHSDPVRRAVYGLNPVMIWSHIDSLHPKLYLESPREVKALAFCPFDENLLVGGCINGQIVLWDITNKLEQVEEIEVLSETREKYKIAMNAHMGWMKLVHDKNKVTSTVLSNLATCHHGPVTNITWLSANFTISPTGKLGESKEGVKDGKSLQFLTSSEDGTILIWNLSTENLNIFEAKKVKKSKRVLKRPSALLVDVSPYKILDRILQPCYKLKFGSAGSILKTCILSFSITPTEYKYIHTPKTDGKGRKYFTCELIPQQLTDFKTDFYVGSMHGDFIQASWEGHEFNTGEVVNSEFVDFKYTCGIHDGVLGCTAKNPLMDSLTLTVGGKIFAIWSDKLPNRPLMWKKRPYTLTDGVWSLYKPSLFFIATSEGDIETWDLLLRSDQPISVQTLSGYLLTHVVLHSLPLERNIIGISDGGGSFRMYLNPPIFQLQSPAYFGRMESMILREIKVKSKFIAWQNKYMQDNPDIILEMKRKEGAHLAEKEEEKRKLKEEQIKREEEEAEARRLAKLRVIGPEERWQKVVQKLIERTIAVKKRINRAELIEHEKPLRELEAQRLEKERRMLDIMKNQTAIFNDTVAILFPEAVKKPAKVKKSLLSDDKLGLKNEYLKDYESLKVQAQKTVTGNPYKVPFVWDETIAEGKERRQALYAQENYVKMHKDRIKLEDFQGSDEQIKSAPIKPFESTELSHSKVSIKKSLSAVVDK